MVFSIKLLIVGVLLVWQNVGLLILQEHYKIDDINCLLVDCIVICDLFELNAK